MTNVGSVCSGCGIGYRYIDLLVGISIGHVPDSMDALGDFLVGCIE
eukprot:COSAG05_NODE_18301_length_310_cov_0.981043_1_plen_45_part_10